MGGGGGGGWGCTPVVIGGVGWRHHDVTGLNFYISGCDPSSRHHFLADGRGCACGVSSFEALNPSRSQTCVLDFQKKVGLRCIF